MAMMPLFFFKLNFIFLSPLLLLIVNSLKRREWFVRALITCSSRITDKSVACNSHERRVEIFSRALSYSDGYIQGKDVKSSSTECKVLSSWNFCHLTLLYKRKSASEIECF